MKHTYFQRIAIFVVTSFTVVIAIPLIMTWRVVRQQRLNRQLVDAVRSIDTRHAIKLLNAGADPNITDGSAEPRSFSQTLLRILDVLRGRKRAGTVTPGEPMLSIAVRNYQTDVVRLLLSRHAKANAKDDQGYTALMLSDSEAISRILLDHGADVNESTEDGNTKLMHAALIAQGSSYIDLLLNRGAKINAADSRGRTALMYAVEGENVEGLRALLRRGADPDLANNEGKTALMLAAHIGGGPLGNGPDDLIHTVDIIRTLIHAGAKLNACDHDGKTALGITIRDQDVEYARLLKAAGAKK